MDCLSSVPSLSPARISLSQGLCVSQIVKPNKFAPCKQMYEEYYECSLVKETSFGKFIGRCNSLKANLDACNMRESPASHMRDPDVAQP